MSAMKARSDRRDASESLCRPPRQVGRDAQGAEFVAGWKRGVHELATSRSRLRSGRSESEHIVGRSNQSHRELVAAWLRSLRASGKAASDRDVRDGMKPTRTSFAVWQRARCWRCQGQAAEQAPTRASAAHWDARQPAALTTLPTSGANILQSLPPPRPATSRPMNLIGLMYVLGVQVPIDYSKAVDWFQKAIDGGSASAMHNLAQMYLYGIGVPRDYTNAFRWFQRSAAYGNVHGVYSAAVMAENGLGTARDLRVSRALYHDAAESGFAPAMVRVSDELARGAAKRDLVEYAWLRRSPRNPNSRKSCRLLRYPGWRTFGAHLA